MKILQVVHSFVPYTMAGSEVYSYKLSKELAKRHKVYVFFRVNDAKRKEYSVTYKKFEDLETYAVNHTFRSCNSFSDTYSDKAIDAKFAQLLDTVSPDIVHIHHLLFLSYGLVDEIKKRGIPVIYTLHDYWLICHRGQLIKDDLTICKRYSVFECEGCLKYLLSIRNNSMYLYSILKKRIPAFALQLLKRLHLVITRPKPSVELKEWKDSSEKASSKIDLFIAPSSFIRNKFVDYGFPGNKILHYPYGFDCKNFIFLSKNKSGVLRFGYMGTLLPMKGVDFLISAFKEMKNRNIRLSIYGKLFPFSGFESYPGILKKMVKGDNRIELAGGYNNKDAGRILANIDVLIVPSLWLENAPLVIQEAFLSRTPVIASRIGGIPELINDGVNGLLFNPGDANNLREKMQYIVDNPDVIEKFKEKIPEVKSIEENGREMEELYNRLLSGNVSLRC